MHKQDKHRACTHKLDEHRVCVHKQDAHICMYEVDGNRSNYSSCVFWTPGSVEGISVTNIKGPVEMICSSWAKVHGVHAFRPCPTPFPYSDSA